MYKILDVYAPINVKPGGWGWGGADVGHLSDILRDFFSNSLRKSQNSGMSHIIKLNSKKPIL